VAKTGNLKINLFFTGNRHAGENLKALLEERSVEAKFIQMNDALASNSLGDQTIECNCLVHARINFHDLLEEDPLKCRYVIKLIQKVYNFERLTTGMSGTDRLRYHQKHSLRIMSKLRRWCYKMFFRKKVEPNSNVGKAITYLLRHWRELTQF
jgi:transposase